MTAELHNQVARDAVTAIIRPMVDAGATDSAIMVVLESVIFGVLLFNERRFGVKRRATVERLDSCETAVMERLARGEPEAFG